MAENRSLTPREIAQELERLVNNLADDGDDFKEIIHYLTCYTHRTLQQSLFRKLVWPLIKKWGSLAETEPQMFDLRNQATVETCHQLVETVKKQWGSEDPPIPFV
jgi:hypothetical protein